MLNEIELLNKYDETQVTFIDKINNIAWPKWKQWKDCSQEEKDKANLRQLFPCEIILDFEDKQQTEDTKNKLIVKEFYYFLYESGSRGVHFHLLFDNLAFYNEEQRTQIRKLFIKEYNADETKSSEKTLIAMCDRPHFKSLKPKTLIIDNVGVDTLEQTLVDKALKIVEKNKTTNLESDVDFVHYFEDDPFFLYVKNNIIPDGTNRNDVVFPNLAVAAVRSGKTDEQIKEILAPIFETNFPGKTYAEFKGWLKKARTGIIKDYNPIQINNWVQAYTQESSQFYNLTPQQIPLEIQIERMQTESSTQNPASLNFDTTKFVSDKELEESVDIPTEWIVDQWIPKGDICFIAGKAASFKTTIALHITYAMSKEKLVFNTYKTSKNKILYLNEENPKPSFKKAIKRIKKGLELETVKDEDIWYSILESNTLDNMNTIKNIISFIKYFKIDVLVLDSFRRFFIGKENEADVINVIFNKLKAIRQACGGNLTIIILHHAKKGGDNSQEVDLRDILRGSSDIVNMSDSVIGVTRAVGGNYFTIAHIKTRGGEELKGRRIKVEYDKDTNSMNLYETNTPVTEQARDALRTKPQECAEKIYNWIETTASVNVFQRSELPADIRTDYEYDTITKAFKELAQDGMITKSGGGAHTKYVVNRTAMTATKPESETIAEFDVSDSQETLF
jgi:KaiC/GvpD/RAD55 family RecA-like ATPase